jgi:TRAP-type C4-dicarboxylate transport system substrate-binding protein
MRHRFAALILTATVAGCSFGGDSGADKAGGSRAPLVLRLANTNGQLDYTPTVVAFVDRVEELSGGDLRVEAVDEWGEFATDAERQVVKDVAAGAIDLGWVGTRVFDTLDVNSFQALTAPMLIDSYALESAVIESGITEQMMRGLHGLGVAGLGVLPDSLRKPAGVSGPIVSPADWRGITFGTLSSNGQAEAIRALGATPEHVHRNEREERLRNGTLQGFETSVWIHQHNPALTPLAPYMTSNVTLWPQMDVLLANPARLEALTDEQRGWLKEAARDAAARSAVLAATDGRALTDSCMGGARFAEASDADLAALRRAFRPVYAGLRRQPATREFLARIEALKRSTTAEAALAIPAGCTGEAPARPSVSPAKPPSDLNGTYRWVLTQKDADRVGDHDTGYPHVNTITLKDGRLEGGCFGTDGGIYSVQGDRITFHSIESGEDSTVSFSRDGRGNLHLQPVPPIDAGGAFECFSKPWTRIG